MKYTIKWVAGLFEGEGNIYRNDKKGFKSIPTILGNILKVL